MQSRRDCTAHKQSPPRAAIRQQNIGAKMSFSREEVICHLVQAYVPPALEVQRWKAACDAQTRQSEYLAGLLRANGQPVRAGTRACAGGDG